MAVNKHDHMATGHLMDGRCTAKAKSTGERCRQPAIPGGTVCRFHGGACPQVQRKARERIIELRDVAAEKFLLQLQNDEVTPPVTMAAVRDLTKTAAEMEKHESDVAATSIVDEWLASLEPK